MSKFNTMKRTCNLLVFTAVCLYLSASKSNAQCPGGYTQAQLNWDNLDYYFNSGGSNPYGNYINDAREQNQRFAIGTTWLSIATSSNALVSPGTGGSVTAENGTHTGDVAGYTGDDAQYNPSSGGQTITITFNDEVQNVQFTLYDVDRSQRIDFAAQNAASVAQTINVVTYASSILTITNNDAVNAYITANSSTLGNTSNQGTATITVAGPVRTISITVTTVGSDAVFWLSDINACVTGSFPSNWHQGFNNRPWQGFTQNQPDYFLVTPDNNSCYMMDPATGRCWWLFTDASRVYMNSFAYDPDNKYLYYISENPALDANNRALKRYDFNTESISTVIADIRTTLDIPTFNAGVESAAAAFYNGRLYMGIEGGQSTSVIRESHVWCIDLASSTAYQVYATPCYNGSGIIHDWADILVKDGELISYNSSRTGSNYSNSSYTHFNLMTGAATKYMNPSSTNKFSGQAGLSWNGTMYMIYDSVWVYNAGVISSRQEISVISVPGDPAPPAWAGNAGDGSDPFRPKCDFGDAPASYDPNPLMPAVHERSEAIRLGATWDREWLKRGTSGTDDVDDGTPFVNFFSPTANNYLAHTYVTNNSGAAVTLIAWLDYNGNGVFDASEAITPITVPNGTNNGLYFLYWPAAPTPLTNGQFTYMRVRVTSASAGMTSAHATGYFTNGEVEDYRIPVDNFPLSVSTLSFQASILNNAVARLNWSTIEQPGFGGYEIQKSRDAINWEHAGLVAASGQPGEHSYEFTDDNLIYGKTYFRLKLIGVNGSNKFSETRYVTKLNPAESVVLKPNPVRNKAIISIEANTRSTAELTILTENGKKIFFDRKTVTTGRNTITIPIKPEWPAGVYLLKIFMNNETITKKMVIEK